MQTSKYHNINHQEVSHFYYVALRELVESLLSLYFTRKNHEERTLRILDAGCGTGQMAKVLMRLGRVTGVDVHSVALGYARKKGIRALRASIQDLPFPSHWFDVVVCLDVLYHQGVKDDRIALSELYRVLVPKGLLVVRVPALGWLWSGHDEVVHARHRYQKNELSLKLTQAGFSIVKLNFSGLVLLPLACVGALWYRLHPVARSSIRPVPRVVRYLILFLLRRENEVLLRLNLPIGVGLVAVCQKSVSRHRRVLS